MTRKVEKFRQQRNISSKDNWNIILVEICAYSKKTSCNSKIIIKNVRRLVVFVTITLYQMLTIILYTENIAKQK